MDIHSITKAVSNLPKAISSVSQETWKTVSAIAAGTLFSAGSTAAAHKVISRPKATPTNSPAVQSPTWDELGIDQITREKITSSLNSLQTQLNQLKKEGQFQIPSHEQVVALSETLGQFCQAISSGSKDLDGMQEPRAQAFTFLQNQTRELRFNTGRYIAQHRGKLSEEDRNGFLAALPHDLINFEDLLNSFNQDFNRI